MTILLLRFLKILHFLIFTNLNIFDVEGVATEVVVLLEKSLEGFKRGLVAGGAPGLTGGGEGVAAEVVVLLEKSLEGFKRGLVAGGALGLTGGGEGVATEVVVGHPEALGGCGGKCGVGGDGRRHDCFIF